MIKTKNRVLSMFVALLMTFSALVGVLAMVISIQPTAQAAFNAVETIGLGGANIDVGSASIDPITIAEAELSWGVLKISQFDMSTSGTGNFVFSGKWPYKNTPVRSGSYEYAFTRSGNTYKLANKGINGNMEIPINGIVVSTTSNVWESANLGATLTKSSTFTFPTYVGAVDIMGTGDNKTGEQFGEGVTIPADNNIRISISATNKRRDADERIYYNSEWGKESAQNEFGAEVKFALDESGGFVIDSIRAVRDTNQLQIGATSFVLSVHGSFRVMLLHNFFVKVGDKANLVGVKFVDLNKSNSLNITKQGDNWGWNPTGPLRATDLDDINGNKYFPGMRAANYFMYYDKDYVKSTHSLAQNFDNFTGCNDWGYEVLVQTTSRTDSLITGVVVESGKQITTLPEGDYFILSGNGTAEAFLIGNSLTGTDIAINITSTARTVTATSTTMSYISTAEYRIDTAIQMVNDAIDAKYKLNLLEEGDDENNNKFTRAKSTVQSLIGTSSDGAEVDSIYGLRAKIESYDSSEIPNLYLALFNGKFLQILEWANYIESLSYTNPIIMSIAAWHRPNLTKEKDLQGILDTIEIFKSANMNTIYVETFWNGYSMGDNSQYVDYHKDFVGNTYIGYNDYLDAFISECHKAGIEVHAWVENFFVGYEGYDESNVLTGKLPNSEQDAPDKATRAGWVIRDYQNNDYCQFEGGRYKFIDPSNPEVRKFLQDYYVELLTRYDFDGLNLDYIRYPVQNGYNYGTNGANVPSDHGYSEFAAAKFLTQQGITFSTGNALSTLKTKLNKSTSFADEVVALYQEWWDFKTEQVTIHVSEIKAIVDQLEANRVDNAPTHQTSATQFSHDDIMISTAIFAGNSALTQKNQDWETWVKLGYIEITTPMAYYQNTTTLSNELKSMINKIDGVAFNYAGIAPYFMGMAPINEVYQAVAAIRSNAFGTVIFDTKSIINSPEVVQLVSNGIYSFQSIVPHAEVDVMLNGFATEMKSRTTLYGIEGTHLVAYNSMLDQLDNMPSDTAEQLLAIISKVREVALNPNSYATHAQSRLRISEEMTNLQNILTVRYRRMTTDWTDQPQVDVPGDNTALVNRYEELQNVSQGNYSDETYNAFKQKLAAAKAVIDNEQSTQQQIDTALEELNTAFSSLARPSTEVDPPQGMSPVVLVIIIVGSVGLVAGIVAIVVTKLRKK